MGKPLPFGDPALTSVTDGSGREKGPVPRMQSIYEILMLILGIARFFIIAHFIMSWLINFQVLNLRQPIVAQIWDGLNRILEPIYGPIRRMLPSMGGIDLSPIVALVGIYALEIVLRNNAGFFVSGGGGTVAF
jgi:YggT family protein